MIAIQSRDPARTMKKQVRKDTFEGCVTDLIATHEKREPGPQAFLVEQDAHWVTPPHFHLEHQFQIITAGSGSIGRHAVAPLMVHYAAPETGYGPISAGAQGISYMTLRANGDTNAWYLHKPGSRERMRAGLKREQQHGTPKSTCTAQEIMQLGEASVEDLIAPRVDGLAAHMVRMGPGQDVALAAQHLHGGRYYVVTQGSASLAGLAEQSFTLVFVSAEEAPVLHSGPDGAEVLILQFPHDARPMERIQ